MTRRSQSLRAIAVTLMFGAVACRGSATRPAPVATPDTAALMARKLAPGGVLHAATDWPDYAEHIAAVLGAEPLLAPATSGFAARPETKFETRGRRLGHPIRDLFYRRRG